MQGVEQSESYDIIKLVNMEKVRGAEYWPNGQQWGQRCFLSQQRGQRCFLKLFQNVIITKVFKRICWREVRQSVTVNLWKEWKR